MRRKRIRSPALRPSGRRSKSASLERSTRGNKFSKVLYIVTFYSEILGHRLFRISAKAVERAGADAEKKLATATCFFIFTYGFL